MGARSRWKFNLTAVGMTAPIVLLGACSADETGTADRPQPDPPIESAQPGEPAEPASSVAGSAATAQDPSPTGPAVAAQVRCDDRWATIVGTPGADLLRGTDGRDVIVALAGDDVIENLGPRDRVCAGPGDDRVDGSGPSGSAWMIDLGAGKDWVRMRDSTDTYGGPGSDHIVTVRGPGHFDGGPGDDYLRAISQRPPDGYPVNGPCLIYREVNRKLTINLATSAARGDGHDTVVGFHCVEGSSYDDVIIGTGAADGISSYGGDDLIQTGGGSDSVLAGAGNDRVYLGAGDDYANGETGDDRLYGDEGADTLEGWTESDYLHGGAGDDEVYGALFCAIGGNSYDTAGLLDGAPDELFGGSGDDRLVGDKGNDRLDGGAGYDRAQPGYHDGRIDWVEGIEQQVAGCPNTALCLQTGAMFACRMRR